MTILKNDALRHLSEEERLEPELVFMNFFENYHLSEVRDLLREVRDKLFSRTYVYVEGSWEHENMIFFFEKLEKLAEASYLIK